MGLEERNNNDIEFTIKTLAEKKSYIKRAGEIKTADSLQQTKNAARPEIITLSTRLAQDQWLPTRKTYQLSNNVCVWQQAVNLHM